MKAMVSRRSFVGAMAGAGMLVSQQRSSILAAPGRASSLTTRAAQDAPDGPYTLPDLPYDYAALESHIDTLTMQIHHDKHHAAYVANLNKAVADYPELQALTVEQLVQSLDSVPEEIRMTVRNNAGGHFNHSMFWETMGPAGTKPSDVLTSALDRDLGGLEAMQTAVNEAGTKRFGSGWSWLVVQDGKLAVVSSPNQDSSLMDNSGTPILGVDVWEHAYYLLYQNKRADYLTAWWNVVNWDVVSQRYFDTLSS